MRTGSLSIFPWQRSDTFYPELYEWNFTRATLINWQYFCRLNESAILSLYLESANICLYDKQAASRFSSPIWWPSCSLLYVVPIFHSAGVAAFWILFRLPLRRWRSSLAGWQKRAVTWKCKFRPCGSLNYYFKSRNGHSLRENLMKINLF